MTQVEVASRLPSVYQPDRRAVFQDLFVNHYVDSFAAGADFHEPERRSWMRQLPEILHTQTDPVLDHSLRAAITAFYGRTAGNQLFEHEGRKLYGLALESQRQRLRQVTHDDGVIPTTEAISAAFTMASYEVVMGSIDDGWAEHECGAAVMLQKRGPEQCCSGWAHKMFLLIRIGMVSVKSPAADLVGQVTA